jgi:hypothetical protein
MEVLEDEHYQDIIAWSNSGRSVIIHRRNQFILEILPRNFNKTSKFSSFARKMNRWGFGVLSRGPEAGAYFHPLFQKGGHKLIAQMSCQSANTNSTSLSSTSLHTEYYRLTQDSMASRLASQTLPDSDIPTRKQQKAQAPQMQKDLMEQQVETLLLQRQWQASVPAPAEQQLQQQLNIQLLQELIRTELARNGPLLRGSDLPSPQLGSVIPPRQQQQKPAPQMHQDLMEQQMKALLLRRERELQASLQASADPQLQHQLNQLLIQYGSSLCGPDLPLPHQAGAIAPLIPNNRGPLPFSPHLPLGRHKPLVSSKCTNKRGER